MVVIGYKCFYKNLTNIYGVKFEEGKIYTTEGNIKFGLEGNGFHMCKRLEDTLRYFNGIENEVSICMVKGSGQIIKGFDDYNEYYDMYSVENIEIIKKLSRSEIINTALNLNKERIKRFIKGFKLTDDEIAVAKEKFKGCDEVIAFIEYYQEKRLDAFEARTKRLLLKK